VFEGIGDDGDVEFCLFDIENGQAGAVEADGAFFYDEVAEFFGEFEAEFPAAVELAAFEAGGGGVDVSLDDVAVEPAVHGHASFEVDQVAGLPAVEISFCEGLFDGGNAVSCAGVVGSAGGVAGPLGSGVAGTLISSMVRQTPLWETLWSIFNSGERGDWIQKVLLVPLISMDCTFPSDSIIPVNMGANFVKNGQIFRFFGKLLYFCSPIFFQKRTTGSLTEGQS